MGRLTIRLAATAAFCLLAFFSANAAAVAPSIVKTSFSAAGEDSVVLEGEFNPGGRVSKYHFEYGAADCASNPCTSIPVPDGTIPASALPVPVKAEVTGLSPGTTYHFRLVASNVEGSDASDDRAFTTFTTQGPFPPCPNDGLRLDNPMQALIEYSSANLPDCRAYEQVSPVDKNGSNATGTIEWVKSSPVGDAFTFLTTSGMPGAESLPSEFPTWLSGKGASDWSTQGLFASIKAGQSVEILGWLPDFSEAFELVRREGPPQEIALFARDSDDHALTEIVPYRPPTGASVYAFIGASADGQTVIFESSEQLTPAAEGKRNVYAWDSDSGALRLVSLLPEAECDTAPCAPPAGAFGGSYTWIGQSTPAIEGDKVTEEGGAFDRNYTQDSHVVSPDGRYAYFTATKTGQLYVRINPTKAQSPLEPSGKCETPALACTLRVSASKKTDGDGEGGSDAAGPRPAAFMTASADGKKTFFTSPEKLTNDANTGPEPPPASIARAAIDGTPASVDLDFLFQRAGGLAVGSGYLYWADPEQDTIGRAKLNGTGNATGVDNDFIEGADNPQYVAVDAGHVYWTNAVDGEDGTGSIGRATLNGEDPPTEVDQNYVTGASNPTGIAVDATYVYWGNAGSELPTRTIGRAKLGATKGEEVEQDFIQIDTGSQEILPQGVAVNAAHIYLTEDAEEGDNSYVARYDLSGELSTEKFCFDAAGASVKGIALDAGHVYWGRQGGDSIGRVDLNMDCVASREREFIKEAGHPFGLALDAEHLYWSANQKLVPNPGNDLYRFDVESGALKDLTPDPTSKDGARVVGVLGTSEDGSRVYFAANGALATGASAGNCQSNVVQGNLGSSGECSLYLYQEGQPQPISYLARLDASDGFSGDATNWLPGRPATRRQKTARVSADGATLLFSSRSQLTSYPNEGVPQLYRYRVGQGILCISCNPTGMAPTKAPGLGNITTPELLPFLTASRLSRNLSPDGSRVFFETTDALVAADTNGAVECPERGNVTTPACQDVYEWEASGTGSCESAAQNGGCLYLLTTGKSTEASYFGDASVSGDDAFVFTYAKLVGQDQDQLVDIYDASVDGGLAVQSTPPKPICDSTDACQGPAGQPPASQSPGSESFKAPGNHKAKKPGCPKGKRKVRSKGKTRCVAKHKGKGKGRKRAAKKTRRATR